MYKSKTTWRKLYTLFSHYSSTIIRWFTVYVFYQRDWYSLSTDRIIWSWVWRDSKLSKVSIRRVRYERAKTQEGGKNTSVNRLWLGPSQNLCIFRYRMPLSKQFKTAAGLRQPWGFCNDCSQVSMYCAWSLQPVYIQSLSKGQNLWCAKWHMGSPLWHSTYRLTTLLRVKTLLQ